MAKKHYYGEEPVKKEKPSLKKMTGLDSWDIFKGAAGLVAGGCASTVIHRYLQAAVPKGSNVAEKIIIAAGVYFVTGLVGHKVEMYIMDEVDEMKVALNALKKAKEEEADDNNG